MPQPLTGRTKRFTDHQLRNCLHAGMNVMEIADKLRVTHSAVSQRISKLQKMSVNAQVQPYEAVSHVRQSISAIEQLLKNMSRVNRLMDACDLWLTDPDNPQLYSVDPRSQEVDVVYTVAIPTDKGERMETRKAKLSKLLNLLEDDNGQRIVGVEKGEFKHADPRELILKTAQETRQTVSLAADIARMLSDAKAMETFRESLLVAIRKVSPETASDIAQAVQSVVMLNETGNYLLGREPGYSDEDEQGE